MARSIKKMQMRTGPVKKGTFGRLMKYLWGYYKWQMIIVALGLLITAATMIVTNIFLQQIIDKCIVPGIQLGWDAVKGEFFKLGAIMIVIFIAGITASLINTQLTAVVTQGFLKHLREDMFNNMETLPIKYFDTHQHGAIMSTYTNDTDAMRQLVGQSIPTLYQSCFSIAVVFGVMLYYSLYLTLIVIGVILLMFLVVKKIGGASSKYMVAQQQAIAAEEGFVEEMIKGQKVVKVFNHEHEAKSKFDVLNEQLYNDGYKAHKYGNILMPILGNMGNIMYVLLAFVGSLLVFFATKNVTLAGINVISIGAIVAFLSLSRQVSQTIGQASMQVSMIAMGLAGAARVFELIDEKPEQDEGYVMLVNVTRDDSGSFIESDERTGLWAWKHYHKADGTVTYVELKGDIELDNVDFAYEPDKQVLYDVTLRAKPGQKFAFVGATGAGKTTITNLLNRFYGIQDGKIRYDGININKINKNDLRQSLGIVLQDTNLFTGTVMDNIRYGRLEATDDECIEAAKMANADDFIQRLPDGYQTMLRGNGNNLSQGQRQLLSIARAAVADPPVMILDEATSSIDTRTEALVQRGMDNLMKGRTVFVIAHRLSTIRNADSIIVLDHGRIIERGTHDQLIAQRGTYYQLYTGVYELE